MNLPENEPYTPEETRLIRQRQAARSKILGLVLFGMCILFFAITVAKIGVWG